jgi:hypothetical protein
MFVTTTVREERSFAAVFRVLSVSLQLNAAACRKSGIAVAMGT